VKDKLTLTGRLKNIARPAVLSLVGLGAIMAAQPAVAGQFGVQVINEAGDPVKGASVCVGLPGNYKQFGALFTDANGQAMVEVPNVPFVVTVSKTRFSGIRLSEPARGYNLIKTVTLADGVPGPRCRADSTLASKSSIVIKNIEVLEGTNTTNLRPSVTGQPSHYRVSRTPGFDSSQWRSFNNDIALSASMSNEQEVYLQMRRYEGSNNGWIEARSEVVTVHLPITR